MHGSHHGLVAKSGRLARGRIHLRKPLCVRSQSALAKTERTIHFPRQGPSTQGYPGSSSPPAASAWRSPAPAPSAASPGPPANRHIPSATGSTSATIPASFDACAVVLAELKTIGTADLEQVVKTIGVAVLGGLATGGETGAIAAGIAAAPAAFEAAGKDISAQTTRTLVNTVLNQVSTASAPATAATTATAS